MLPGDFFGNIPAVGEPRAVQFHQARPAAGFPPPSPLLPSLRPYREYYFSKKRSQVSRRNFVCLYYTGLRSEVGRRILRVHI